jgi:hypothetical protein
MMRVFDARLLVFCFAGKKRMWLDKATVSIVAAGLVLGGATMAGSQSADPLTAEARAVVKPFASALGSELKAALETGGPVAAIDACKTNAPVIAGDAAKTSGWRVERTALKLRNPSNAPDAWERQGLEAFAARAAAGQDLATLERAEIVSAGGHRQFRFMKAIPTAEMCTTCHGATLKPDVAARLRELYPDDQAVGFSVGDLRGAFTLTKQLD